MCKIWAQIIGTDFYLCCTQGGGHDIIPKMMDMWEFLCISDGHVESLCISGDSSPSEGRQGPWCPHILGTSGPDPCLNFRRPNYNGVWIQVFGSGLSPCNRSKYSGDARVTGWGRRVKLRNRRQSAVTQDWKWFKNLGWGKEEHRTGLCHTGEIGKSLCSSQECKQDL